MFWWPLLLMQSPSDIILLESSRPTTYTRVTYETVCRGHKIKTVHTFDYKNRPMSGVVEFKVNGRSVEDALDVLRLRAAGRTIDEVAIMNCGFDAPDPVIRGYMKVTFFGDHLAEFPLTTYFDLRRRGMRWRLFEAPSRPPAPAQRKE